MLSAYLIGRVLLEKRRAEEQAAAGAGEAAPPPSAAEPESSAPPADGDGDSLVHHKLALSVAVNEGLGLFSLRLGRHGPLARGSRGGSGVEAASGEEDLFAGLSPEDLDIHPPEEDAAAQHGGAAADAEADAAAAAELREAGEGPPRPGTRADGAAAPAVPLLNICIMVAGTRGDVQPFIPIARALKAYGHRVRLASHACYRAFVESFGLEFFPLGGDPQVLSEYIVRNRGALPKLSEVHLAVESSQQVREVLHSTFKACTEPDPADPAGAPFLAQAIISNPPTYGHIHCAEKLGVPLHMIFTMPWTPTAAFPCPLAHVPLPGALVNKLSYGVIADIIWSGMLHMINSWRQHDLDLPPIRTGNHGGILVDVHKVPFSYIWSEAVVPKPADWRSWVDVVGYQFLEESSLSAYQPPPELAAFLEAGPPVYVGFGSLVMDDPVGLTRKVVEAGAAAGVRLLISKGWGGLGEGLDPASLPDHVFVLDQPCPHDYLFPRCTAVVHHGGAGTTAAGLKAGRPTCIIPVFGDQHYWGFAVHRLGAGPAPIPIDSLTRERLADGLRLMQQPEVAAAAAAVAERISQEDGTQAAVDAFHRHLPLGKLLAGERIEWDLAAPQVSNVFYETGAGMVNVVARPVKGAKREGAVGALKGAGRGLVDLGYRPAKGVVLSAQALAHLATQEREALQGSMDAGGEAAAEGSGQR